MAETTIRRHAELGPLHDLLLKACPPHKRQKDGKYVPDPNGTKSISILAQSLSLSPWAVHKWVKKGKVPPGQAARMVDNNPDEVSLADFSPFVYL